MGDEPPEPDEPIASGCVGGTHPPDTHTQSEAGICVVQAALAGGGGGAVVVPVGVPVEPVDPAGCADGCVGGTQPPATHTQLAAGIGVVQAVDPVPVLPLEEPLPVPAVPPVLAPGAVVPAHSIASGWSGGTHPPWTQSQSDGTFTATQVESDAPR